MEEPNVRGKISRKCMSYAFEILKIKTSNSFRNDSISVKHLNFALSTFHELRTCISNKAQNFSSSGFGCDANASYKI